MLLIKYFSVGIGLSGSGALKFSALMTGMWNNLFHLKYFAIGNTEMTAALQPPMFNPLELGKIVVCYKRPHVRCPDTRNFILKKLDVYLVL